MIRASERTRLLSEVCQGRYLDEEPKYLFSIFVGRHFFCLGADCCNSLQFLDISELPGNVEVMPTTPLHYHFTPLQRQTFNVAVERNGVLEAVGTVRNFYIRHLERHGWEATGPDGHLAVHEHRWQAAWALTWNRKGYPFPVAASHQREMVCIDG
jgi:hypothetical protein